MARFNEILAGRFNRALQKITGIKGAASTPQLATEIVPSFSLFWGAECRYLEGWNRFFVRDQQAASAANVNATRLRNPVGSGIIAVFEKMFYANTGSLGDFATVSLGPFTGDFAGIVSLAGRFDSRGNPSPSLSITHTQAPAPTQMNNFVQQIVAPVGINYDFILTDIQEFTLLPGDAVQMQTNTVNNTSEMCFWWRERPLEDSEKF